MPEGILSRFPDVSSVLRLSKSTGDGVGSFTSSLSALKSSGPGSPLSAISQALSGVEARLNIDVTALSSGLPSALATMESALPAGSLDFVHDIEKAYTGAQTFLSDTPIVQQIAPGKSLQETAFAVISDVLDALNTRHLELSSKLIDSTLLDQVRSALTSMSNLRDDFAGHRQEFAAFLSQNLIGAGTDLLKDALGHGTAALGVTSHFDATAVEAALGDVQTKSAEAYSLLLENLESFDPADASAYAAIQLQIDATGAASKALSDALSPFYGTLRQIVDSHAWDTIFSKLQALFEAITIPSSFSVNDMLGLVDSLLNELLMRIQTIFGPEDVANRVQDLSRSIQESVADSPLTAIEQTVGGFLDRIREAIDAVPTDDIREAVQGMLGRVKEELNKLNLEQAGVTIKSAFNDAESFVTNTFNDSLKENVHQAVSSLVENLRELPINDLGTSLNSSIAEVARLIAELEAATKDAMNDLSQVLSQLEGVTFKPAGDEVVLDINDVRKRLQAIKPDALSDVERLALKGALALLQSIDLKGSVAAGLKSEVHAAAARLRSLLNDLAVLLEQLKKKMDGLQPEKVLGPVTRALDDAVSLTARINGKALLVPFYKEAQTLGRRLDVLAPGRLLDPLMGPFQTVTGTINKLDPEQWLSPLKTVHDEIDHLINLVDITPLLNALDRRVQDLLASLQKGLLDALDGLNLPEPLASFLALLRPLVEEITGALFGDPQQELPRISQAMVKVKLSALFTRLDQLFDQLISLLRSVPKDDLTAAVNAIREGLGSGMDAVDPRNILEAFRRAQGVLAGLSPSVLLGGALALPSLRATFETQAEGAPPERQADVAATLARFDAAIGLVSPDEAFAVYDQLERVFRERVNALTTSGAEAAYGAMRQSLERIVPQVLRSPQPFTYEEAIAAIETFRPSQQTARLDNLVANFLQKIAAMQSRIQPAVDGFFKTIHDVLSLINPLSLKDKVASIYETIRQKVSILDPKTVAEDIRTNIFEPVLAVVKQIDPAQLKVMLEAAFERVIAALTGTLTSILDDIAGALDGQLQQVRDLLAGLSSQLKQTFETANAAINGVIEKVEHLIFVEILDHLRTLLDNLEQSFGQELDRVLSAFDDMLSAIPLDGGRGEASAAA